MKEKTPGRIIKCNPAFIMLGVLALISENGVVFTAYMGALFLHEGAHALMVYMLGCDISEIYLLPYGCRMKIENLESSWDELIIALCGPICSFICFMGCRLIPGAEPFAEANMYIALINLLPVFPLDGGRALNALLTMLGIVPKCITRAVTTLSISCIMCAAGVIAGNATMIIFAVFLFGEGIGILKGNSTGFTAHMKNIRSIAAGRGVRVQHIALRQEATLGTALSYGLGRYAVFCILDGNMREIARVDGIRLTEMAARYGGNSTLEDILPYVDRSK